MRYRATLNVPCGSDFFKMKDESGKMKACAKRAKAKFTWAFTASAAKVQAHEVGLKMTDDRWKFTN